MGLVSRAGAKRLQALALAMPVFQTMVSDVPAISTHTHQSGVCYLSGKHLYVLTELSNSLLTFPLSDPTYPIIPHPDSQLSVIPPSVPEEYHKYMNAAELIAHPVQPVLYASNRLEMNLSESTKGVFKPSVTGDAVAVATLTSDGKLGNVQHVRTGCNAVRAMQLSPDGKFVALAGQNGGGMEIWSVGDDGKTWTLVSRNEKLEGITDVAWL